MFSLSLGTKIRYFGTFRREFERTIVIFKGKNIKFETLKMSYLGNFEVKFEKNYCHILNQHLQ